MVETLYKTRYPKAEASECYTLSILSIPGVPAQYQFTEKHGWWDEDQGKFLNAYTTLQPDEGMTFGDARAMYERQRTRRVKDGFVHSFTPDYSGNAEYEYKQLELHAARFRLMLEEATEVGDEPLFRAVAINVDDEEKTAETLLSSERMRSLLMFTYGGEASIVDVYVERLLDRQVLELDAEPQKPAIFSADELIRFGFSGEGLEHV